MPPRNLKTSPEALKLHDAFFALLRAQKLSEKSVILGCAASYADWINHTDRQSLSISPTLQADALNRALHALQKDGKSNIFWRYISERPDDFKEALGIHAETPAYTVFSDALHNFNEKIAATKSSRSR